MYVCMYVCTLYVHCMYTVCTLYVHCVHVTGRSVPQGYTVICFAIKVSPNFIAGGMSVILFYSLFILCASMYVYEFILYMYGDTV